MQLVLPMNRALDMYAFAVLASMATGFIVNPVSLAATSSITAIVMLNAFTILNPLVTDASAKRSWFSFFCNWICAAHAFNWINSLTVIYRVLLVVELPADLLNRASITKASAMPMPCVRGTPKVTMAVVVVKVSEVMVINAKVKQSLCL